MFIGMSISSFNIFEIFYCWLLIFYLGRYFYDTLIKHEGLHVKSEERKAK